jgi:hypothetical protein
MSPGGTNAFSGLTKNEGGDKPCVGGEAGRGDLTLLAQGLL